MKYQVQLDAFEGSLEDLIKGLNSEEVSADEIPICTIIDQFIEYYLGVAFSELEEGSRFLVLAATLLVVKARLLLPRSQEDEDEELFLGEEDDQGLLVDADYYEYLAFQDVAATLEERAREWMMVYRRPPQELEIPEERGVRDDVTRLVEAFQGIMERISKLPEPYIVKSAPYDLDELMVTVLEKIESVPQGIIFDDLFSFDYRRGDVIFTFLAVLELVYEGRVRIEETPDQKKLLLFYKGDFCK